MMVQGAGFEPAKHYAQRPERCPFDHSGTPAQPSCSSYTTSMQRMRDWEWCRGQDLNLRSTTHWDLNPAPLTTRVPLLCPVRIITHQEVNASVSKAPIGS